MKASNSILAAMLTATVIAAAPAGANAHPFPRQGAAHAPHHVPGPAHPYHGMYHKHWQGNRSVSQAAHRPMARSLWQAVGMLQLTEAQQKELREAVDDLRNARLELLSERQQAAAELRDLYAAEQPDAKAIGAVYAKIFNARRERIEAAITARNRVFGALTEEQRAQLRALRHRWNPRHHS